MAYRWMTAAAVVLLATAALSLGIGLWGEGEAPGFYGQKLFCMALPGLSREGDDRWPDSAPCTVEAVEIVHM